MTKYEVIKQIMDNPEWDEECKIFKIKAYLLGWLTVEQATGRKEGE